MWCSLVQTLLNQLAEHFGKSGSLSLQLKSVLRLGIEENIAVNEDVLRYRL